MKEKRIRSIFKTTFILMLLVLLTVTIALFYYYNALNNNQTINEKIGDATRMINSMVRSLNSMKIKIVENDFEAYNDFKFSEEGAQLIKTFNDQIDVFFEKIKDYHFDHSKEELKTYPELLFQTNDERKYITEIGDIAREINLFLDTENVRIKHLSSVITIGAFLMLFLIIIVLLISYFFQEKHFKIVDQTIVNMNALLDGKVIRNIDTKTAHDSELLKRLRKIEKKLSFQNQLLSYNSFGMLETILPEMYPILKKQIDMQRLAVAFVDQNGFVIAETLISEKEIIALNAGFKEHLSETSLADLTSENDIRIINDLCHHYRNVHKSEATKMILSEGFCSSITVPMFTEKGLLGFIFINNEKKNAFTDADVQVVRQFTKILKSEIYNSYLMQELVAKTSEAFADLVEKKDNETGNHLLRVASYSKMIAEKMMVHDKRVTPKMIREILWFAPLHDIGKVGIPDKILLKPGKLTPEEYDIMKEHVNIGLNVLYKMNNTLLSNTNISFLDTCLSIIAEHHEKWDGSGYPKGLKGEEITIPGRIIAVADVFDALISKRVYKEAFSIEKAFDILTEGRGKHFAPQVVDIFLENRTEVENIIEQYKD